MIVEQDKTNPNLFLARGKIIGFSILAEGSSRIDAMNQWEICARERLVREWGHDNVIALRTKQ
jgi:hypothetical protein